MKLLALLLWALMLGHPMNFKAEQKGLPEGGWGGEHVSLTVTASGGSLEFDCAHGAFDQPPKLDAQGRFTVTGTYEAEHSGPVRADEKPNAIKVEYVGAVKQGKLQLRVRRVGANRAFAVFNLVHGQEAMLFKCR